MDNELLVKSIKAACSKRNLTVAQLEKILEYSPSLISRWKKTSPSLDKIVEIADYLNISIDELIGRNYDADDSFLKIVDRQTFKHILKWNILDDNIDQNISKSIRYGEVTDTENKTHTYYNKVFIMNISVILHIMKVLLS